MDITKYKETLLEFLSDVTTIPDKGKEWFLGKPEAKAPFDAPEGYKVLSPFVLVKITESTRVKAMPIFTPPEGENPQHIKPEIEIFVSQISFRIYTKEYRYFISANWKEYTPQYLGCIVSTRTSRAGEDWSRGNDLPDGHFCKETWNHIKNNIIANEMVGLSKNIANGHYSNPIADCVEPEYNDFHKQC